jgi:hypothetical protein
MKVAYQLLSRDEVTFEELTTQEEELWNKFETEDINRFLTGKPDMVPEFCFNWITVPRVTIETFTQNVPLTPDANPHSQVQPALSPSPQSKTPLTLSTTLMPNTFHSLRTPSTSGSRPARQPVTGPSRSL